MRPPTAVPWPSKSPENKTAEFYWLFETNLGWLGIRGAGRTLLRLTMGHLRRAAAERQLCEDEGEKRSCTEADWFPALRAQLERYTQGEPMAFTGYELAPGKLTSFQRMVFDATSALPYGATASYREIAERIGRPHAARAVGNALGTNRFPILVPCHRVLASGGRIGGFSAPQGVRLKEKLLALERAGLGEGGA